MHQVQRMPEASWFLIVCTPQFLLRYLQKSLIVFIEPLVQCTPEILYDIITLWSEICFEPLQDVSCNILAVCFRHSELDYHVSMRWLDLKVKLPQAFMQIGWKENDFRNISAEVWAHLDNPIKSYDFSKFWLMSCLPPSQVCTLLQSVMSQYYNCLMELYTIFTKMYLPPTFILGYVRLLWLCMHLWTWSTGL